MPDTRPPARHRPVFDTRGRVVAAWFTFVVVIWPILSFVVATACLLVELTVLDVIYGPFDGPGAGLADFVGLALGLPTFLVSAAVAAVACYKMCRFLTVPLSESKPLAFESGTVIAVVVALIAAGAFWSCLVSW